MGETLVSPAAPCDRKMHRAQQESGSCSGGTILHRWGENIDVGFDRIQLEDKRIKVLNKRGFPGCCPEPRPGNGGKGGSS